MSKLTNAVENTIGYATDDDMLEALQTIWTEMSDELRFKFLNESLDEEMKEECVAQWEEPAD